MQSVEWRPEIGAKAVQFFLGILNVFSGEVAAISDLRFEIQMAVHNEG